MTYDNCPSDIKSLAKLGSHGNSPQNCNEELKKLFDRDILGLNCQC